MEQMDEPKRCDFYRKPKTAIRELKLVHHTGLGRFMARRQLELHHLGRYQRYRYDCGEDMAQDELAYPLCVHHHTDSRSVRGGLYNQPAGMASVCRLGCDYMGGNRYTLCLLAVRRRRQPFHKSDGDRLGDCADIYVYYVYPFVFPLEQ